MSGCILPPDVEHATSVSGEADVAPAGPEYAVGVGGKKSPPLVEACTLPFAVGVAVSTRP